MIIYFDLDRTLFQTSRADEIWDKIGELYPEVDGKAAYEGRSEFYSFVGDSYYHDMSAHLVSLGLDPTRVYEDLQQSELADGRFEYEGCKELLETLSSRAELRVLTFGMDDYQRFKASLCPSLRELPVTTTLRLKADVLEELQDECWLVDDKAIGFELPGNVSFVQVSLEGGEVDAFDWPVFRSLREVQEFFDDVLR